MGLPAVSFDTYLSYGVGKIRCATLLRCIGRYRFVSCFLGLEEFWTKMEYSFSSTSSKSGADLFCVLGVLWIIRREPWFNVGHAQRVQHASYRKHLSDRECDPECTLSQRRIQDFYAVF